MAAAKLDDKPLQKAGVDRQSLKDDFKIIGHAKARDFGYLITADAETMFTYCETLRSAGELNLRAIKLQAGFSEQPFTPDGQSDFIQVMEEPADYVVEE